MNLKSKKGWFRVWAVAAAGWLAYAIPNNLLPSRFESIELAHYLLADEVNLRSQVDRMVAAEKTRIAASNMGCVSGSVSDALIKLPPYPAKPSPPPQTDNGLKNYFAEEKFRQDSADYSLALSYWQNATTGGALAFDGGDKTLATHQVKIWCLSAADRNQKMLGWAAKVFLPPIVVPLIVLALFFALRRLLGWIGAGFKNEYD